MLRAVGSGTRWLTLAMAALCASAIFPACGEDVEVGADRASTNGGASGAGGSAGALIDASGGGDSGRDAPSDSPPAQCVPSLCLGKIYACGDCLDNDADGKIDAADPECLGPCDNTEDSLHGGIPGQNNAPCRQDCYFDSDTGTGNDQCYWSHRCDPLSVPPDYPPSGEARCAYDKNTTIPGTERSCAELAAEQLPQCGQKCLPLVPNGCDCFGCCELQRDSAHFVFIGSADGGVGTCDLSSIADPMRCRPCTPVPSCMNACKPCETCVGHSPPSASCASDGGGVARCPIGVQSCGDADQPNCPANQYCITGCCAYLAFESADGGSSRCRLLRLMNERRILVTSGLPYANGPIHLGHLVEYIQTDIWARFQRLSGRRCVYICGDDTHGTAIMMRARQENRTEESWIAEMKRAHEADFAGFQIRFDNYGSTHSAHNRALCDEFWRALRKAGLIAERDVTQLYDPVEGVFLADRFVKGTCPNCKTPNQYGDSCEKCGATYNASDLIDPKSTLSGATPEMRSAPHLFVQIEALHSFLEEWTQSSALEPEIGKYLKQQFLSDPLRDWDVSRPAPYFGFEIPDAPGQYWFVWFDAPIGYMASTKEWCEKNGENFDDWWRSPDVDIHHFIGKDITYFHTLFWPAMLKVAGFTLPKRVQIHGFLTVNGEKMSKRRGTFIMARTYLEHLQPEYLRYYYASKLSTKVDDIDLNFDEFVAKVNADLVNNLVNLVSRTSRFVRDTGLAARYPEDEGLFAAGAKAGEEIAQAYEECDFARAMRIIMALGDRANQYVARRAPWDLKKQGKTDEMVDVCTVALNLYRQLVVYLTPVLPELAEQTAALLGTPIRHFDDAQTPLVGSKIAEFKHLMARVDPKKIEAMVQASQDASAELAAETQAAAPALPEDDGSALAAEPLTEHCTIDDFGKIDLRVARIIAAEEVPEAKKLVKLRVTLGGGVERTVYAGIKSAYEPKALVGRLVVMVANLKPRQMKFGVSEGMIIAAGPGGRDIFLLSPDSGARPGQRVH